jgi:hypothetical protein
MMGKAKAVDDGNEEATMLRRMMRIVPLVFVLATGALTAPAMAQESTPAASPGAGGGPDFTFVERPDFPELAIVATKDGWQVPAEVNAGRLLASLDNQAGVEFLDAQLMTMPEGVTLEEVEQVFAEEPGAGEGSNPSWLYDVVFPGGPIALADGRGEAVVDLAPGEYVVLSTDQEVIATLGAQPFIVVAGEDPASAAEPASDAAIVEIDFAFKVPDGMTAGPQVWKVTNSGNDPHMLVLEQTAEKITEEQVQALLEADTEGATPAADLPDPEAFQPVGYVPVLSSGVSTWIPLTLQEGYQIALCFVPDQTGRPHAAFGMHAVFEVGA